MIESINVKMKLHKTAVHEHAKALKTLKCQLSMDDDDTLNINYDFYIKYLGNTAACLRAVREICLNPKVVVTSSCEELEQGRILCYETLKELDALVRSLQ